MKTRLTLAAVRSATPGPKRYEMHDTAVRGLVLRVAPSGRKSWSVRVDASTRYTIGDAQVVTLTQARTRALAVLAHWAEHRELPSDKPRGDTLGDLLEAYEPELVERTKRGRREVQRIRATFKDWLGRRIGDVTAARVKRWRSARLAEGRPPVGINREVAALSGALTYAVREKWLPAHPLTALKPLHVEDDHRVRYLSDLEEKRLRAALRRRGDPLEAMVLVSINTGLRAGELLGLTWRDVDLPRAMLTLSSRTTKSRKPRHVPLNDEARRAIARQPRRDDYASVFPGGRQLRYRERRGFEDALVDAGIEYFRWHDLRHHFASALVMRGVDLNTVRELLGHADIKQTLRYAHLAPEHKAAAVAVLDRGR